MAFAPPTCATSSTSRRSSRHPPPSSPWSRTTARRSPSWPPPTPSSGWRASVSPRTCARRAPPTPSRRWSRSPMMRAKSASWSRPSCATARTAWPSSSRRCCSAPRTHSAMLEIELARRNIPFVKFGGLKFVEAAHVKDMLAVLALGREPERPGHRLSRLADAGRHRPGHGGPGSRSHRRPCRWPRPGGLPAADPGRHGVAGAGGLDDNAARQVDRMAGGLRAGAAVVSAASGTALRRCRIACCRSGAAAAHRRDLPLSHPVPDRPDARPAQRHLG